MRKIKFRMEEDQQEESESDDYEHVSQNLLKDDDQKQKEAQTQIAQEKEGSFRLTPPNKIKTDKVFGLVNAPSTTSSVLGKRTERPDIGTLFLSNFEEVRKAQDAVKHAKTELEKAFA